MPPREFEQRAAETLSYSAAQVSAVARDLDLLRVAVDGAANRTPHNDPRREELRRLQTRLASARAAALRAERSLEEARTRLLQEGRL